MQKQSSYTSEHSRIHRAIVAAVIHIKRQCHYTVYHEIECHFAESNHGGRGKHQFKRRFRNNILQKQQQERQNCKIQKHHAAGKDVILCDGAKRVHDKQQDHICVSLKPFCLENIPFTIQAQQQTENDMDQSNRGPKDNIF